MSKVKFRYGTPEDYVRVTKNSSTFYYTDDNKLYLGENFIASGGELVYDTEIPNSNNTTGLLKVIVTDDDPEEKYEGYIYIVTNPLPDGHTDTRLGWFAKSTWLRYDAETDLGVSAGIRNFSKAEDGYAIACHTPVNTYSSGPYLLSTRWDNAVSIVNGNEYYPLSYTVDGIVWYFNNSQFMSGNYNNTGNLEEASGVPVPSPLPEGYWVNQGIPEILSEAKVIINLPKSLWLPSSYGIFMGGASISTTDLPKYMSHNGFGGWDFAIRCNSSQTVPAGIYRLLIKYKVPLGTLQASSVRVNDTEVISDLQVTSSDTMFTISGTFEAETSFEYVSVHGSITVPYATTIRCELWNADILIEN